MKSPRSLALALLISISATGCFGEGREWSLTDPSRTLVSNRGGNRYVYEVTRTAPKLAPAPAPAVPVLEVIPENLREVALINVKAEFGGWGPGGLGRSEADFYPELAETAQKIGATHFRIVKTSLLQIYITNLVVSALAPKDAALAPEAPAAAAQAAPQPPRCVASQLPEWSGASPAEKKALMARCK